MKINFPILIQQLEQQYGLDISIYDQTFLYKSIEKRIQAAQCDTFEDYLNLLEQDGGEVKHIYESLQVHFSEFFRDPMTFALLERMILPELIQKKNTSQQKEIRIWSAGCAAGQEAYSIAILFAEMIANTNQDLNYRIFGTDRDEKILETARKGSYSPSTLKNISLYRAQTWFTHQGEQYIVKSSLKEHIIFSNFDLLGDERSSPSASIFGDFDLVFCCNLLIYYQPQYREIILKKFARSLARNAYLVTGEAERAIASAYGFNEVFPYSAIFRARPRIGKRS